ncbi:MAG TPA: DUF5715 family protein [Gemmatimonadaceae bacterium]|nr:DUF5715 family protein [Gemmatimonadaceae bacterium]
MKSVVRAAILAAFLALPGRSLFAAELRGSPASMVHQHAIAVEEDYSFLRTPTDVRRLVDAGKLLPVKATADFALSNVSYPYTRPEVLSFIEHFAASYRAATGDRLVVTSLTRPLSTQPRNAHVLSVHPAGMAVDLRVPASEEDRAFLEHALLSMEKAGMLDVTREHHPSHFHVAVFAPQFEPYAALLDSVTAMEKATRLARHRADSIAASGVTALRRPPVKSNPLPVLIVGALGLAGLGGAGVKLAGHNKAGAL